jgi:hypothetical protein
MVGEDYVGARIDQRVKPPNCALGRHVNVFGPVVHRHDHDAPGARCRGDALLEIRRVQAADRVGRPAVGQREKRHRGRLARWGEADGLVGLFRGRADTGPPQRSVVAIGGLDQLEGIDDALAACVQAVIVGQRQQVEASINHVAQALGMARDGIGLAHRRWRGGKRAFEVGEVEIGAVEDRLDQSEELALLVVDLFDAAPAIGPSDIADRVDDDALVCGRRKLLVGVGAPVGGSVHGEGRRQDKPGPHRLTMRLCERPSHSRIECRLVFSGCCRTRR